MPIANSTPLVLVALLLCGCRVGNQPSTEVKTHDAVDSSTMLDAKRQNRFDPSAVAVGDSVLGLRIESLDVQSSLVDSDGWVGIVQFEGKRLLSGEHRRHPFDSELDELCFFPDDVSAKKLPVFPNDERTSWLCFTNQEEARAMLGHPSDHGTATIEVDRYLYYYTHSDVYNTARLLRVISYADSLGGHDWILLSLRGDPVIPGTKITLTVSPQQLGGYAGCNWYGGEYLVRGDTLRIEELSMTARLCEHPERVMAQENEFVDLLDDDGIYRTGRYRAEGDEISISDLAMRETECPQDRYLEQEGDYTTALGETSYYLLKGNHLELHTVGGDTLVFERQQ